MGTCEQPGSIGYGGTKSVGEEAMARQCCEREKNRRLKVTVLLLVAG